MTIQNSYETPNGILPKEEKITTSNYEKNTKKIIAVGGAKGGIGKSVFVANLGIILSEMGKKTIVADFDLGGANLHLYLGQTRINKNINDYLNKNTKTIEEVLIQSKYGPLIIGGDSSRLGAANIHFSKKIKLINAIRNTDADYVIIDLGGDTSYNMIDFFNMADIQIVMTTCEPASYLDAYNFIKVSLFRKLTRIFGKESEFDGERDIQLEHLIRETLIGEIDKPTGDINDLFEKVNSECPDKRHLLDNTLNSYKPILVVNKAAETSDSGEVGKRVKDVAKQKLSINIEAIAPILFDKKTEESAKDLVPVAVKCKDGYMANRIREFVEKTLV